MFTPATASGPKTRKAGVGAPTPHNFVHNSSFDHSFLHREAQSPTSIPRIIATHWLRPEMDDFTNLGRNREGGAE